MEISRYIEGTVSRESSILLQLTLLVMGLFQAALNVMVILPFAFITLIIFAWMNGNAFFSVSQVFLTLIFSNDGKYRDREILVILGKVIFWASLALSVLAVASERKFHISVTSKTSLLLITASVGWFVAGLLIVPRVSRPFSMIFVLFTLYSIHLIAIMLAMIWSQLINIVSKLQ